MADNLTSKEAEALRELRNFFMHNGRFPTVRELSNSLSYKSSRSAYLLIEALLNKGVLKKKENGDIQLLSSLEDTLHTQTVDIPLVGAVACGLPILAQENVEAMIPVSIKLVRPPHRYFLLRAVGNSMDQAGINDKDIVLVRQQATAENGDIVVALIDDSATVKIFYRSGDTVLLKPKSSDPTHKPIILTSDFIVQGKVITTIPNVF